MVLYINENILNESVSGEEVINAIDRKIGVLITYDDGEGHNGVRYIEPFVYGLTSKNNPAIRAYQYYGDTKRGVPAWKLLRLDRITSWKPTENRFNVDPKARGFAKEAFNGNDKMLPTIYKIVDVGKYDNLSDIDILRAKTNRLKNSKPINVNDINKIKSGPIGDGGKIGNNNQEKNTTGPINSDGTDKNNRNQPPLKMNQKENGPIEQNDDELKNDEIINDEDFKKQIINNNI